MEFRVTGVQWKINMFNMSFYTVSIDSDFKESQKYIRLFKLYNYLLPQLFLCIYGI